MPPSSPEPSPERRTRRGFLASLSALAGGGLAALAAPRVFAAPADAEGSDLPFIGEIKMVAFNYAPVGWLSCNGQLLDISQNTALFFLLGTTFGGDGQTTFAVPDLRGRMPIHPGTGFVLGQSGGEAAASLLTTQIPPHTHALIGDTGIATAASPGGGSLARDPAAIPRFANQGAPSPMAPGTIASAGGGQPHNNLPPYQALHFIIAIEGIFPSQA